MNTTVRILLIDDDEDDQLLFQEAVNEIDEKIICAFAPNGEKAYHILMEKDYTLPLVIFMDLNMPRVGGKECLKALKNQRHLADIPVIIYTTSRSETDERETQKFGASAFLIKPRSFTLLKSELERTLQEFGVLEMAVKGGSYAK